MFRRTKVTYSGFSDFSSIRKWVYVVFIFIIIALIWATYFFVRSNSGSSNINLKGTIYYKTKPLTDVSVFIDSQSTVSGPDGAFVLPHLGFGSNMIRFEKKGYIVKEQKVFLWRKDQDMGKVVLERDQGYSASYSGTVLSDFDKSPIRDAVVTLGSSTTTTDENGSFEFLDMPAGAMSLKISAIDFWDYTESVVLGAGQLPNKEYDLTPYGRISFTSSRDGKKSIYSINYDGKNLQNLTSKIKADCWSGRFTPDGAKLIFYSNLNPQLDKWGQSLPAIYALDKGSDKPVKLSGDIIPRGEFRISRDGRRLVFLGNKKDDDNVEIYAVGLGLKQEWIQLTSNDLVESNIDISPDGSYVSYGAYENGERGIYAQRIGEFTGTKIASSINRESSLSYSPDGKSLLYVRTEPDFSSGIYLYDIAKRKEKEIYKTSANIKNVTWNKSSNKLIFVSTRDDKDGIYSINLSGGDETKLTDQGADYRDIIWPDMEKILVFIVKKDTGNTLSVMNISKRSINGIEEVSDDVLSWDSEVFDTGTKEGL